MDLWVRSQNKYRLLKVESLQIIYNQEDNELPYYINSSYELLGSYKSKERALEVLDDIQKFITNSVFAKKVNGLGEEIDLIPNPILIYNMPRE